MRKKCSIEGCDAPKGLCKNFMSSDYQECDEWRSIDEDIAHKGKSSSIETNIPWTGMELTPEDIGLLSHRSSPIIIGLIGSANAGKTSYIGMLYTLLFNGRKFNNWSFAGSYTLNAWEAQAKSLKINSKGKVPFPKSTPSHPDYYSLYHLALKKDKRLYDILFADSSGEVFTKWATDTENSEAENAKWIYQNSDGFIFFVDCEALIIGRGGARRPILQLAGQISSNLGTRKVVVVWSKAEKIHEISATLKKSLEEGLQRYFPDALHFYISNFSASPDDEYCYINNLATSETILDKITQSQKLRLSPITSNSSDFFFSYGISNQ